VRASDPMVLGVTVVTIASAALLACWIPAWRAARLVPTATLRAE
jgi:ABC-type lipoprotein release transport system permease subunit